MQFSMEAIVFSLGPCEQREAIEEMIERCGGVLQNPKNRQSLDNRIDLMDPGDDKVFSSGPGLLLHNPKARAHAGLVFGLSLQLQTLSSQNQARPAKVQACILQARPGPICQPLLPSEPTYQKKLKGYLHEQ
jgi:hypothetical protein